MPLNESIVEDVSLESFGELGYAVEHGPHLAQLRRAKSSLAPGEPAAERDSFGNICAGEAVESISERRTFNADRNSVVKGE